MEAPGPAEGAAAGSSPGGRDAESAGGTPQGAPRPEAPTYRLQDFDTLSTVGTGTFGRVHLVREKTGKRFFALKVMSIPDVIRLKQEQHVHNEKSVLEEVSHPFLVRLFWTYHDERFLYMLMEFVPGGELFSYLRNQGRFSSNTGLFYSAEIVCAIEYLHSKEIVYRDLKPENILLDKEGHIKLTDFGFAKKLVDSDEAKGDSPFQRDLIRKLLVVDRTRRLGNMKNGANDVKRHRWFRTVDWEGVPNRRLKPPIVPKVTCDGDTSNFDTYPENDWNKAHPVSPEDLEIFKNF
ncbi:cAMP-dependent protein kinase catalytic subunit PRKX isoform 5-T5 [Trichechus inunguis]